MKFTTKTEYGVFCMVHMARRPEGTCITVKEITSSEHYPVAYTEKIFQALRRAKLVVSHQGNQGGYQLARKPSEITLRHIIDALEGATFDIFCEPQTREDIVCTHFCLCGVKPIWRKTKELLDNFYDSLTLEMLSKNELDMNGLLAHFEVSKRESKAPAGKAA